MNQEANRKDYVKLVSKMIINRIPVTQQEAQQVVDQFYIEEPVLTIKTKWRDRERETAYQLVSWFYRRVRENRKA